MQFSPESLSIDVLASEQANQGINLSLIDDKMVLEDNNETSHSFLDEHKGPLPTVYRTPRGNEGIFARGASTNNQS